ncbi:MAG: AMP-binding protein, partial [Candidatus Hydrogenedentes bacterium]|nr:AMP-binding protein [Candidatus Hydrogenedentota bacterium]
MTHEDMRFTWQYVDKWARIKPEAEAIVFEDKRLTWAALSDCVNRTAKALLELGVEHGHRVAMVSMARPEFLIAFLAANKIGAMWLGLSP